jgi:hypothetical protein
VLYSVYQADIQRVASATLSQVLLLAGSQYLECSIHLRLKLFVLIIDGRIYLMLAKIW